VGSWAWFEEAEFPTIGFEFGREEAAGGFPQVMASGLEAGWREAGCHAAFPSVPAPEGAGKREGCEAALHDATVPLPPSRSFPWPRCPLVGDCSILGRWPVCFSV
jgi:hypothetical protein